MSPEADAGSAYAFLRSRSRFGFRPGLERMAHLLDRLDHPERGLRYVHVAGTNGKGSTCAFLSALWGGTEGKWRIGRYTSPDLGKIEDRIVLNETPVATADLAAALARVQAATEGIPDDSELAPTEFEVLTAAAFLYFAEQKTDLVILESGLGGRYDATNVVTPEVAVITSVGLDHQQVLGDTVAKIAYDKAGIVKPGVPVVTAATGVARRVVEDVATRQGSRLYALGRDFRSVRESAPGWDGQRISYFGLRQDAHGLQLALPGDFQTDNAAVALAACEITAQQLGVKPDLRALVGARWPGRMEVFTVDGVRVTLDGAHNAPAARALANALDALGARRWYLVFGVLADKDIPALFARLLPFAAHVWLARPATPRAASVDTLAAMLAAAPGTAPGVVRADAVREAVKWALAAAKLDPACDGVLVTGSLYTVAEARTYLTN